MIFVAEIGLNHNGNFGLLQELIKQASLSGADIAKFQLGWRSKENEINNITPEIIELIIKLSQYYKIEPMFSVFTNEAFRTIIKYNFNKYKIASRTLIDNIELVKKIVKEKKETYISLGFWKKKQLPFSKEKNVRYLWCMSQYPTLPWNIKKFPKSFSNSRYYGFSDHTVGSELALIAISRGANLIEKHFTLDKSDTTIRDHALSLTPDEFKALVINGRAIHKMIKNL